MKTVDVLLVDTSIVQPLLDSTFGVGVFKLDRTINEQMQWKYYFLEYDDSVSQSTVDQAVTLVNGIHMQNLNDMRVRWYTGMRVKADQKLETLSVDKFTEEQIIQAQAWLNNMSAPVPACVSFIALKNGLNNQQAAEYIVNSQAEYQNLVNQLNTIVESFQANLMVLDMREGKILIRNTLEQINNFPQ